MELHRRHWGEGPTQAMMIHGFGEGSFVWDAFAPQAAACLGAVTAVDLRGHGESPWDPEARYVLETHLEDVVHVLDGLGMERTILIGHSLGGLISIVLAALAPQRVAGVVIADAGPDADPAALERVRADLRAAARSYDSTMAYAALLRAQRPFLGPGLARSLAENLLKPGPDGGFVLRSDPALGRPRPAPAEPRADGDRLWTCLARILCPVLLVRGIGSAVLRRPTAARMIATLPDGRLETVDNAGHGVMTDNPDGFAAAVLPFLHSLNARG